MKTLIQICGAVCVLFVSTDGFTAEWGHDATATEIKNGSRIVYNKGVDLEDSATTSANASVGDLNGDGTLDILLVKGRHWPVVDTILFGDGKGGFDKVVDLNEVADRSYTGALADVDQDGDLDIVVSNDRPDPNRIYLNDGQGHFTTGSTFGQPQWKTRNIGMADVNEDGLPDILVANRSATQPSPNYICLNLGGGRFQTDCMTFSDESATTITPADLNDDGRVDLVVPHRDGGQSYVFLRQPGPEVRFDARPFGASNASIRATAVADFNADGLLDIVAIHTGNSEGGDGIVDRNRSQPGVSLYYGRKKGGFSDATFISERTRMPYALAISDLNRDGAMDILVGHVQAPTTLLFNRGAGHGFNAMDVGDREGTVYGFATADLNEDGVVDIVAARSGATNQLFFGEVAEPK